MEALNQAESTIYQTEKTLEEVGDKVSEQEKTEVKNALEELKKVKDNESATSEEIRKAIDEVMNKFHTISQKMYEEAQKAAQQQDAPQEEQSQDDNVVDADYEEVDKK